MNSPVRLSVDLLEQLKDRWRRHGAPLLDRLQPGLPHEEIERLVAPLGLQLPQEVELWWGWHDGVPAGGPEKNRALGGPEFTYLPLAEAVHQYNTMRELAQQAAGAAGNEGQLADPDSGGARAGFR